MASCPIGSAAGFEEVGSAVAELDWVKVQSDGLWQISELPCTPARTMITDLNAGGWKLAGILIADEALCREVEAQPQLGWSVTPGTRVYLHFGLNGSIVGAQKQKKSHYATEQPSPQTPVPCGQKVRDKRLASVIVFQHSIPHSCRPRMLKLRRRKQ